ncbi:MAG: glycosyltransferase [Saprospiraceae bacterium]
MLIAWIVGSSLITLLYVLLQWLYRASWDNIKEVQNSGNSSQFITVLIPARNEAANIAACIAGLVAQKYPTENFEILLIDDHSIDGTKEFALQMGISNLRVLSNPNEAGKKSSLKFGFQEAKGDWVLCTDADCFYGPQWLSSMANAGSGDSVHAVVGPIRIAEANSSFSYFQSLDIAGMSMITAAAINNDWFRMANGANLGIRKETFFAIGGYDDIDGTASGDDVLLVQKIEAAIPGSVIYLKDPEAIVATHAVDNWTSFLKQRIRWGSKYNHYLEQKTTIFLAIPFLLHWILLVEALSLFYMPQLVLHFLVMLGLKLWIDRKFLLTGLRFFNIADKPTWYLSSIWYQYWYILVAGTASALKLKVNWK